MKTRISALCLRGSLLFSCDSRKETPKYQEIEGVTGTIKYRVKYISIDTINLKLSIDSVARIIDNSLSVYSEESIVSKINRGYMSIKADEHSKKVYTAAHKAWKKNGGKYNPTVGLLMKIWGFDREMIRPISKLPTNQEVDSLE